MSEDFQFGASSRADFDSSSGNMTVKSDSLRDCDANGIFPTYKTSIITLALYDYYRGEIEMETIGENCFCYYERIQTVVFGTNAVTTIKGGAFHGCINLSKLAGFSGLSKLTTIGDNAFYDCQDLKDVSFPSHLSTIGERAFYKMGIKSSSAQVIDLPASLTSVGDYAFGSSKVGEVTIRSKISAFSTKAFNGCSLNVVKLPNFESNGEKLSSLAALEGVTERTQIVTDKLVGYLTMSGSTVTGFKGFYDGVPIGGMSSSISSPTYSSIANVLGIDKSAIINVKFPSDTTKIGTGAFLDCTNLKTATQMDSVTSIENGAFSGCTGLTVTVPSTVTSIGNYAFKDVAHVYYSGSASGSPWGAKAVN